MFSPNLSVRLNNLPTMTNYIRTGVALQWRGRNYFPSDTLLCLPHEHKLTLWILQQQQASREAGGKNKINAKQQQWRRTFSRFGELTGWERAELTFFFPHHWCEPDEYVRRVADSRQPITIERDRQAEEERGERFRHTSFQLDQLSKSKTVSAETKYDAIKMWHMN